MEENVARASESQSFVEFILVERKMSRVEDLRYVSCYCLGISRFGSQVWARTEYVLVVCQIDSFDDSGVRGELLFLVGWVVRDYSRFVVALVLDVFSLELLLDLDLFSLTGLLESAQIFVFSGL